MDFTGWGRGLEPAEEHDTLLRALSGPCRIHAKDRVPPEPRFPENWGLG